MVCVKQNAGYPKPTIPVVCCSDRNTLEKSALIATFPVTARRRRSYKDMRICTFIARLLLVTSPLITFGQTSDTGAAGAFEVASVRPSNPDAHGFNISRVSGGRFVASNASVRTLIIFAFNLRDDQLFGAPPDLDLHRFDIAAKAPSPEATLDQMRTMVRALLAERFRLASHNETRHMPVYILRVDRPKLRAVDKGTGPEGTGIRGEGRGVLIGTKASMGALARVLASEPMIRQGIVDETGLTDVYDFTLRWTPESPGATSADSLDLTGPSLFTALKEQLGLRLEHTKRPSEVVVIDRVEYEPTAN